MPKIELSSARSKELEEKIIFVKLSEYNKFLKLSARNLPDIDDADFLSLALSKDSIIWSNDKHLKQQPFVKTFTTSELLIKLFNNKI